MILTLLMATIPYIHSSPHPAMGSSAFTSVYHSVIQSKHGFTMNGADTTWDISLPDHKDSLIFRVFTGPENPATKTSPSLSVRVETLDRKLKLKNYVKRWVREYPYYGFKILASKFFNHKGEKGFAVEVESDDKTHRLRQAIFLRGKKAVVLTCSDHKASYKQNVKDCHRIMRTFSWNEKKRSKKKRKKARRDVARSN